MLKKDACDVAQEIRMERQVHKGVFLIVEGRNDQKTLYRHIDENTCSIVIANNKENAIEALQILEDDGFPGVVCLVDADFDEPIYKSDNLIVTDAHDMDVIVFCSKALDNFLYERVDHVKLNAFQEKSGKNIRDTLFEAATPVGILRLLSQKRGLKIKFSNMSWDFIDEINMSADENKMLTSLIWPNRPDREQILKGFEIVKRQNHPKPMLCQGHDLMTLLGKALRHCLSNIDDERSNRQEIEMGCRLAFGRDEFEGTELYKQLEKWQAHSGIYNILFKINSVDILVKAN